jgi:H+/gluconate symporter-like permease
VLVCALLTYGGVSLFVGRCSRLPVRREMFRQGGIPKRLIPATIALGAFTFTMDALPGTPQIQNIIPTTFFKTDTLGGAVAWRHRRALHPGQRPRVPRVAPPAGGARRRRLRHEARQRARAVPEEKLPNPWLAVSPLVIVGVMNKVFTLLHPAPLRRSLSTALPGLAKPVVTQVSSVAAIWSRGRRAAPRHPDVVVFRFRQLKETFRRGQQGRGRRALLAATNTASEYGFGAVIAALPGFLVVAEGLKAIPDVLVNEAVTVTALAGITGSASGGMSIALATMADRFAAAAHSAGIRSKCCTGSQPWRAVAWTRCRTMAP